MFAKGFRSTTEHHQHTAKYHQEQTKGDEQQTAEVKRPKIHRMINTNSKRFTQERTNQLRAARPIRHLSSTSSASAAACLMSPTLSCDSELWLFMQHACSDSQKIFKWKHTKTLGHFFHLVFNFRDTTISQEKSFYLQLLCLASDMFNIKTAKLSVTMTT